LVLYIIVNMILFMNVFQKGSDKYVKHFMDSFFT
jgi:hypothetical protein